MDGHLFYRDNRTDSTISSVTSGEVPQVHRFNDTPILPLFLPI